MMKEYTFAYGRGSKAFSLDESRVLQTIEMPDTPPLADIRAAVLDAVAHPIGCAPLAERVKPGDTVTFICNDPTRVANSFDFMPVLVDVGVHDPVAVVVLIYFFVFDMHVCASGTVLFNKIYRNSRRFASPPGG